jgi:molybdopterin synthase sulfur carrier subunit
MSIKVNIHPSFQRYTNGLSEAKVEGSTVGECLDQLVKQFPDIKEELFDINGELLAYVDIYVNHKSAYPEELNKVIKDGDELDIVHLIFGG